MRFQDDGGTRAWRANQATFDMRRPKRSNFGHVLVLIVFFSFVLPWLLILDAPALGALWDAVFPGAHAAEGACGADAKLRWSGSGAQTTRPFHMDGGWEVQWRFTQPPNMFQVMVRSKADPDGFPSVAANQMDGEPGSAYQPKGGDYFLMMNTFGGKWTVCVVPVP